MRLRLQGMRAGLDAAGPAACVGSANDGSEWVWLAWELTADLPSSLDVAGDLLLERPADVATEDALKALLLWPGWRVARAARLEIGSGLLVLGGAWPSQSVLSVSLRWGVLWRAAVGSTHDPGSCEHRLPESSLASAAALVRSLPSAPDAVIITGNGKDLPLALEVCRTRGVVVVAQATAGGPSVDVNLYRDAHRRGLTLVAVDPFHHTSRERDDWLAWAGRSTRLFNETRTA